MALKVSRFLHRILLESNPLSDKFKQDLLPDNKPKQERDPLDVLSLGTFGEWVDDVGTWVDPPEEEFNENV